MAATHVALLRAVNLGPHNKVAMADLRALASRLGVGNPVTLLQSGNLVFESAGTKSEALERRFEAALATEHGIATEFFVRTAAEWQAIVAGNPFTREAKSDPGHLVLMCLKAAPARGAGAALQKVVVGREVVKVGGRSAYITYPDGMGESKLTNKLIERTLGTSGTARNWNTVLKIGALLGC